MFDTVEFNELNSKRVDKVKYLVFNDGKNRFGLIAGIKDEILRAPFSAPYACFSPISKDNKMLAYNLGVQQLVEFAKLNGLKKIRITLPPTVYDESHIAKLYNSFYVYGFKIAGCDINYQYNLQKFSNQYEMTIDPKARQKLRASLKENLIFTKTLDIKTVYEIIYQNRKSKGYPLWMTYENILETEKIIKMDFFTVAKDDKAIASALVYHIAVGKVQVIYWGNLPETDELKPMNFLAFKIFEYYKQQGFSFFDIGPSSEFSRPNFGLCDFKQGLGCDVSSKITFELDL